MKKIIRVIIFSALCLFLAEQAGAQEKLVHFGVKAGLNMATLEPAKGLDSGNSYKDNLGYQAGIALQFNLPLWFSVEPDILFNINSAKDSMYKDKDGSDHVQGFASVLVPVNIQWGPSFLDDNMRVFLQVSPFVGGMISKDFRGNIVNIKDGTRESFDNDNFNRFQYGGAVGLGVKAFAFQVTAEYFRNMGSITSDSGSSNKKINPIFKDNNFGGFRVNLAIIF